MDVQLGLGKTWVPAQETADDNLQVALMMAALRAGEKAALLVESLEENGHTDFVAVRIILRRTSI